jgi:hypothetical protein
MGLLMGGVSGEWVVNSHGLVGEWAAVGGSCGSRITYVPLVQEYLLEDSDAKVLCKGHFCVARKGPVDQK